MIKPSTLVLSLTLTAAAAPAAHAAICIQLDAAHDNLSEQERAGLMTMFASTLQQQGQQVVAEGCQETWVVYHVRLGYSINVFMQSPRGPRQATARVIEDVPPVYSQMVHSLLTGLPMNTANGTVDRTNATAAQQAPRRVEADSLWYARLGYGGIAGPIFNSGPAMGLGYRYELDSLAIDVSFFNLVFASRESMVAGGTTTSSFSASGSWIKLMALYYTNPMSNASLYLGGGVGWGAAGAADATRSYGGSGLQGELAGGYEFLRASTIRLFAQFDASIPFYMSTSATESAWTPTFALSLGMGWGRSINRVHIVP